MTGLIQSVDDIDTRREVQYLFQILPSVERVRFLYFCCDLIGSTGKTIAGDDVFVTITNETGEPTECYLDFWAMVSQYGLPIQVALAELEHRAVCATSGYRPPEWTLKYQSHESLDRLYGRTKSPKCD